MDIVVIHPLVLTTTLGSVRLNSCECCHFVVVVHFSVVVGDREVQFVDKYFLNIEVKVVHR